MKVKGLLNFDLKTNTFKPPEIKAPENKKTPAKKLSQRGCNSCPLNEVSGLHKFKSKELEEKEIVIWLQSPSQSDTRKIKALTGDVGEFFWDIADNVGLKRKDCNIEYVVRCSTLKAVEAGWKVSRPPSKSELKCCSIYSEEVLDKVKGKAKVHLILGAVAAKQLLRGEFRKDKNTFYSDKLDAWVVLIASPASFLKGAPRSKIKEFRDGIEAAVEKAKAISGKFTYLKEQDYTALKAKDLEEQLKKPILEATEQDKLIAIDIEDGEFNGKKKVICVGFSWKKGMARQVFLDHPEVHHSEEQRSIKLEVIRWILENKKIKKAFHYGASDCIKLEALLGIKVKGFVHDTMYSEYLRYSNRKAYGLGAVADTRFREFGGYKDILNDFKPNKDKKVLVDFMQIPVETLILYNGADCDLTYRIAAQNRKHVNLSLLKVYIKASFQIYRMEEIGPYFDPEHDKILVKWIPLKVEEIKGMLQQMVENKKFNPNSSIQVQAAVYDKFRLGKHLDLQIRKDFPRSTKAEIMEMLGGYHEFPVLLQEYRVLSKKNSTYMNGYRRSAEMFHGRVRTNWWLTGTITGRLRSSGDKDKSKGKVNLQNIHGDPCIENLLVSDPRWRSLYKEWLSVQKNVC